MTSTLSARSVAMKESAVASPYMKLVHAASMSHATAPGASSSSWMRAAMDGNGPSGDDVPTRIMSRSLAEMPAASSAPRAALVASSRVVVPGSAMCRVRMPVRSVIQLSDVSIIFSRSKFVMTFSGAYMPTPAIALGRPLLLNERSGTAPERVR